MLVQDIYNCIDAFAPFDTAEEYDNCGLIVGNAMQPIHKVGLALDITHAVIDAACAQDIDLIVTHHPVIFDPIKKIDANSVVYRLIQNGIAVISAHTNLDRADGGLNTVLSHLYGLADVCSPAVLRGLGRLGTLPSPVPVVEYAAFIKHAISASAVRYLDSRRPCHRVVCISGSGGSHLMDALACGADTLITGDLKHDQIVTAINHQLNLIEAGHFEAESMILKPLAARLSALSELEAVILCNQNPMKII